MDDEHSGLNVEVNVSPQFFGCVFSLGSEVKVTGPEEVVMQLRDAASEFVKKYE